MGGEPVSLLAVCTGNASRSVMAGIMLERLAVGRGLPLSVVTAGTHAVDGLPLGARTALALRTVPGLAEVLSGERAEVGRGAGTGVGGVAGANSATTTHRSRQLDADDLDRADLVVAMETGHVRHVRRLHPLAAARTGMLRVLARDLPPGPAPLARRVAGLRLEHAPLDPADDVADPAGHDEAAYIACAAELWVLCDELVARL